MKWELLEVRPEDYTELKPYFRMRDAGTCENIILDTYLWKHYYNTRYFKWEHGLIWIYENKDGVFTTAPQTDLEHMQEGLLLAAKYFHEELHKKLHMYLVDESAVGALQLSPEEFTVEENRDYFDYVYDAEKLRTLPGKKYHKKKNHVNAFLKEYGGRYEFRMMCCEGSGDILDFLERWKEERGIEDSYHRIEYESRGIAYMLEHCKMLKSRICGVYIDGRLEAFSIGSYNSSEETAYIHVEKANPEIRGLYPFINREFLCQGFPEAKYVNREDDMGIEGLRKAKLSYHPMKLVKKYDIIEKGR